ncbi:MAG: hypothetical protein ACP5P4_11985 [Steroidobacteraceae bacterium]
MRGYWALARYRPAMRTVGERSFRLDSPRAAISVKEHAYNDLWARALSYADRRSAEVRLARTRQLVTEKYR